MFVMGLRIVKIYGIIVKVVARQKILITPTRSAWLEIFVFRLYRLAQLYIGSAMYTTRSIVLNFFYILFYIDISYQLLNEPIFLSAPYSSLETNPTWGTLIRR